VHGKSMKIGMGVLALMMAAGTAKSEERANPALARGEHIARLVCSACHNVAADQEFPPLLNPAAPDFREIANRPGITAAGVRHFVMTTHWNAPHALPMRMPDPMLLPEDADCVARYLLSLRKP